ncbi:MAG: hypothetical protein EKK53_23190 [Burkholderiales bacterium]|nr:MAG: hypothetical protein EKK53_23190 [Burkholderiales bacterium]
MGSAVSSIFGGGGAGGILGAVGGIVGGIFGGPIGSMIGQAVGNLLNQAIGQAFNQAIDTLVHDHGMPKFLGDEVKAKAGEALGGLLNPDVSHEATNAARDQFGASINEFRQNLAADMTDRILANLGKKAASGDQAGTVGKGGKAAGGGWLQAIAAAMGAALGDKAAEMVSLSEKMTALNNKSAETSKTLQDTATAAGADPKSQVKAAAAKTAESADQKNARDFNLAMTQFQATSQEYSMLNNVFSTAIKALGESLSSMARKQ